MTDLFNFWYISLSKFFLKDLQYFGKGSYFSPIITNFVYVHNRSSSSSNDISLMDTERILSCVCVCVFFYEKQS